MKKELSQVEQEMSKIFDMRIVNCRDISAKFLEENRAGIYAWYYKTPVSWRGLNQFFTGDSMMKEVVGNEQRNGRAVRIKWLYPGVDVDRGEVEKDDVESNFFQYAALWFSRPLYIGYSSNLIERLSTHASNIKRLCEDAHSNIDSTDDDDKVFTGWLQKYILALHDEESSRVQLHGDDFLALVLVAKEGVDTRLVFRVEQELIGLIQPMANRT